VTSVEIPQLIVRLFDLFPGGSCVFIFFACAKKTEQNQKKAHPVLHSFGGKLRSSSFAGFSTGHPWPVKNARRPCRAPSGYSRKGLRCSVQHQGVNVKSQNRIFLSSVIPAKAGIQWF